MADDAANDRELDAILGHVTSDDSAPSVIVCGASNDDEAATGNRQQQTPAPMASFEALSEAEDSVGDGEDDNSEALRELATTLDIPSGRRQHTTGATSKKSKTVVNEENASASDSLPVLTSPVPLPPPSTPITAGNEDDVSQKTDDDGSEPKDDDPASDPFATDDVVADIGHQMTSGVPTLVVDGGSEDGSRQQTSGDQSMWEGWTADGNEDQSWVMFEKEDDDDDEEEDDEDTKQQAPQRPPAPKPNRPPPPTSAPSAIRTDVTRPINDPNQLQQPDFGDLDLMDDDEEDAATGDKKKMKIKLKLSPKKLMQNISGKKDKKKKESSAEKKAKAKSDEIAAETTAKREFVAPKTDSEEWKKFQEMQDRINQVLMKTSEKVTQMEQGFQTEIDKLNVESQKAQSPWIIVGSNQQLEPDLKSPDKDGTAMQKSSSWVGFEDTFDAEQVVAVEDDPVTVEDGFQTAADCKPVSPDDVNEAPAVVVDIPEIIEPDAVEGGDNGVDPFQTENDKEPEIKPEDASNAPEVVQQSSPTEQELPPPPPVNDEAIENKPPEPEHEEAEEEDAVDPFDVTNVVTAMTSGKPLSEVIGDAAEKEALAKKMKENERLRLAAEKRLVESSGGKARPRPRAQMAAKSANPFKIALMAALSVDTNADDDSYEVEDDTTQYVPARVSSANPFTSQPIGDLEATDDWDALGLDSVAPVVTSDADGLALWSQAEPTNAADFSMFDPDFSAVAPSVEKDKDSGSIKSSRSSIDEPTEPLEPLDPFYPKWDEVSGWTMFLRTPLKKKLTKNRSWKQFFVRIVLPASPEDQSPPRLKVYTNDTPSAVCVHELSMGPSCALRQLELQQFDQFSKCHTVKVEQLAYVEKLSIKADRIAPTVRDLTKVRNLKGFKDLMHKPKTTMILSHSPSATESFKFCTLDYIAYKQFVRTIEDVQFALKKEATMRGKIPNSYTKDEILVDMVDEYYADIDHTGHISYHKARVRLFSITFLSGRPVVEIGINDRKRRGNEIVGRYDIIPIKTEDWIRYEDVQLHAIVDAEEYEKTRLIKFNPPDACRVELMRFRVRPRINVELPLQIGVQMSTADPRCIEIRADLIIPGYYSTSRRASQVACEDIQIRFPIPESLVYMFRVERRFKYGSIHSAKKKPGRIKGLERLAGLAGMGQSSSAGGNGAGGATPITMQASSGLAKYEHIFRSVVWRIGRLPERNQGAYKTHLFMLKLELGPHDTPPTDFARHVHVEYKMADCTASRAQVRSVSLSGQFYEEPPDRWVRHLSKYEYTVEIDFTEQLKAPTHTEALDLDDVMMLSNPMTSNEPGSGAISSGGSSAGDSTAEESSDSSGSDSD